MLQEYPDFDDTLKMVSAASHVDYNTSLPSACFHLSAESSALATYSASRMDKTELLALDREEADDTKLCILDRDFYGNIEEAWTAMLARDSFHGSCIASKLSDPETLPLTSWIECRQVDESLAAETFGSTYNDTSDEESDSSEGDSVYEFFDDLSVLTADSTMEAFEGHEEHLDKPEEEDCVYKHEVSNVDECKNQDEEETPTLDTQETEDTNPVPESISTPAHEVENGDSFQYDLHLILQDQPTTHHATDDFLLMSFLVNFCADNGR